MTAYVGSPAAKKKFRNLFLHHFTGDLANGVRLPHDCLERVHLLQAQQLHQMSAANIPPHHGCR